MRLFIRRRRLYCEQHRKLFPLLIKNWRDDWGQGDFPFLFVQLPAFKGGPTNDWPLFRETQLEAWKRVKNTGMAITIDTGEEDNIHPACKKPVGIRLALLAPLIRVDLFKKLINFANNMQEVKDGIIDIVLIGENGNDYYQKGRTTALKEILGSLPHNPQLFYTEVKKLEYEGQNKYCFIVTLGLHLSMPGCVTVILLQLLPSSFFEFDHLIKSR